MFEHQCQQDVAAPSNTLYVYLSNTKSSMQMFATMRLLMDSGLEDPIDMCIVFQVQAGNYHSQKLAAGKQAEFLELLPASDD